MKNIDLYSMYVSRPVRLLVYLFGLFVIIYIGRLITAINERTKELESTIQRSQAQYHHTIENESLEV
jgi:hypothetical protein